MKKLIPLIVLILSTSVLTMAQNKAEQLYAAVQKNDKAMVESLLKKEADPNYIKQAGPWMKVSPLITAVNNSNVEIVKLLVANNAQVDWRDGFNTTALMYAAANGNKKIVELLIANGADVNATDGEGNTVLSAAKEGKNEEVIALIESKQQK
ncbi:ankyrin repeat domain-containing protein [Pontibacter anaerobius]|uniref:Ankyrin repeat domain-containing protein n=1 Tax=Pontibacter anaerobius TaxID=2993940 RepID=A0ABT3RBG2_9BACT|nr:ankyrin repeat domain-containing protein [Pontibacter anaerobius]MCX2738852.1 ankyrin repeat domain-containing protein [Pontibacter anaerobius]